MCKQKYTNAGIMNERDNMDNEDSIYTEDANMSAAEDCVTIETEIGECNDPPEPEDDEEFVIDYDLLYDSVQQYKETQNVQVSLDDVQHPDLVPTLRPYQTEAVKWAVNQEQNCSLKGGILADEMGLGKTVEVLALILNNPRPCLPQVEPLEPSEPIVISEEPKSEKQVVPRKKKKGSCIKCAEKTIYKSIENVIWRFSPDKEKCVIQGVIDNHCSSIIERKKASECSCNEPTVRERLNAHYNNALAQFSGLRSLQGSSSNNLAQAVTTLCICGEPNVKKPVVQCLKCKKYQHTSCVNYDVTNPYRGEYYCPQCWMTKETISSKATLIVTPSSICQQWVEEIQRHVHCQDFKVLVYQGVSSQGYRQPLQLATEYNIIITTYEVLRKELYFAEVKVQSGEKRRRSVTYMAPPSPLLSVEFWRLCLDEAQMVEGSATRAAEMARKFRTVHRWCVTGTPIQKSVFDLYGLFLFLDLEKFQDRRDFVDQLETPFKNGNMRPLVETLAPIFWRKRKAQVMDQVQIPPQEELVHWLKFSPLEDHFYQQQHQLCKADAMQRFFKFRGNLGAKISSVDRHTINNLLLPLLRLRQACVHPQMVRGQFVALRRVTLTMEQLLVTLIKRAKTACEESQRQRVVAANGLASLHIIRKEWPEAVEKYRDILRWVDELKDSVETDPLPQIHTLVNLAEVLKMAPAGTIPPTLRDDSLAEDAEKLKKKFLGRALAKVQSAQEDLAPLTNRVSALQSELEENRIQLNDLWWTALLQFFMDRNLADKMAVELREKLEEEARSLPGKTQSLALEFRNANGLKYVLFELMEKLDEGHKKMIKKMRSLQVQSPEELSKAALDCHLRPFQDRRKKDRCQICTVHDSIEDYEAVLFRMGNRKQNEEEEEEEFMDFEDDSDKPKVIDYLKRGTWADSEVERMLKFMLQFGRKQHVPATIQEGGNIQIRLFEAYKKEFRQNRILWQQLNDQASAIDELSMATSRLRLRLPHEVPERKASTSKANDKTVKVPINLLEPYEIDVQISKNQVDLISGANSLKRNMGHVLYLKNLERTGFGSTGDQNPDPCPVCRGQLGSKWSVLLCGHSFCMECIQLLINQCQGMRRLRCAICREMTDLPDISYVDTKPDAVDSPEEAAIRVQGSHSTKVEAVIKQLLLIKASDPDAKCLIFSTWVDVLLIISRALDQNGLTYCTLLSHKAQNNLNRFKREPGVMCLLIPVQSGANGLNLIEATHVLLVEPILNPGSELQAIGRVHRIGQTKPTVVHRFLVRNTVEEKMALMLDKHRSTISSRSAGSTRENPVTLADLKALFEEQI